MLSIPAQTDSFFEVVHAEQMVFPLAIKHAKHDHALVIAHGLGADQLLLGFVALFELVEDCIA